MGLILDSSRTAGETEIALSVVTLIELARADTAQRKRNRQQFIEELLTALPVHPVTVPVALRVGQIDGESQARGVRLPLADRWRFGHLSRPNSRRMSSWGIPSPRASEARARSIAAAVSGVISSSSTGAEASERDSGPIITWSR